MTGQDSWIVWAEVAAAEGTGAAGVKSSLGNVSLVVGAWAQERNRADINRSTMV
jgi:hypothetical protein